MRIKTKKPTLHEIAESTGVSPATVSMVLAGKGRISPGVRQQVLSSAKLLGYKQKNEHLLQRLQEFKRVGIFLQMDDAWAHTLYFMRPIIISIEKILRNAGYTTVLLPISYQMSEAEIQHAIDVSFVNAIVSIHYGNEKLFSNLEAGGMPVILVNNTQFQNRFHAVCVDDFQGAYEGTLHLLDHGHTRIVYAEYTRPDMTALLTNRFIGFKKALDDNSISFVQDGRITIEMTDIARLKKNLEMLFSCTRKPTAIFAHDDRLAAFIISVLHTIGLSVPDNVSIIAPGDVLDYNEPFVPKITTMHINTVLLGKIAAENMINRLQDNANDIHVLNIKPQLVERGSCRTVRDEQ